MNAFIYCRISADREGAGLGVERQRKDCEDLAKRLGWSVVFVYEDNDLSAYSGKPRPGYIAMLEALERGEADALIVWHTDRLHRSPIELEGFIGLCEERSITVQSVQSGALDLSTPGGQMNARIVGAVARHEIDHARKRMAAAHKQHAEDGRWRVYGQRPFGWEAGGQELRTEEADAIRDGAAMLLTGQSLRAVVRDWTARGLTTSQGKAISTLGVRRIMTNGRAAGLSIHHGVLVGRGTWPTILTEDQHEALTVLLKDPKRRVNQRGAERKWQGSGVYRCGKCGDTVRSFTVSGGIRSYRCNSSNHLSRRQEALDDYVTELVVARLSRDDAQLIIDTGEDVDIPALTAERGNLADRLDALSVMFADGDIDRNQLKAGTAKLKPQIAELDKRITAAREIDPIADLILSGPELAEHWGDLEAEIRGRVIDRLMTVTILPSPKGRRGFDEEFVDIEFKA